MPIEPRPDRDSRFPDRYCTTCGRGFKAYLECGLAATASVAPRSDERCNQDGIVPENPPNPNWHLPMEGASEGCPNAPMNATVNERPWPEPPLANKPSTGSDDGWTTVPIGSRSQT